MIKRFAFFRRQKHFWKDVQEERIPTYDRVREVDDPAPLCWESALSKRWRARLGLTYYYYEQDRNNSLLRRDGDAKKNVAVVGRTPPKNTPVAASRVREHYMSPSIPGNEMRAVRR